ncbi:transporter [Shinella sumterensis]|uniref:TRAP transporter small permease n=1 Tax=Shinella sumterensis TaxID=1967501 RepID=UPI00106ED4D1|nr:TRAP transporter small permease [Shinella sumterensis]MCD1265842.1 TRAP transporter small permease subunit [Shinella sumterensis]TFE97433.1 transporter [Shinella sumterensis]
MTAAPVRATDGKAGSPALRFANLVGEVLDRIAILIAVSAVVVIFLALMAEVVVRYFTSAGLGWPNEVPSLLFPWLIMGGIVVGAQRGAHIAAEALRSMLDAAKLRLLLMGINLLVAISFAYLAWLSLQVIQITRVQVFPMTGFGQAWAYSSLLFGFGGIALAAGVNLIRVAYAADPRLVHQTETEHMT